MLLWIIIFVCLKTICYNPNDKTTQPQHNHNAVVGLDTKITVQTPTRHHHRNSTKAFRSFVWMLLTMTEYNVIRNNKQGNNNDINNDFNPNNKNTNNSLKKCQLNFYCP